MEGNIRRGDVAFIIVVGFLLGVFAASLSWTVTFSMIILIVAGGAIILLLKRFIAWKYLLILVIVGFAGIAYYTACDHWVSAHTHLPSGKQSSFFGFIADEPKSAGNFMMFPLELSRPYRGNIEVFVMPTSHFHYGDFIWLKGTIDPSKDVDGSPDIFLPQSNIVTSNNGFWLKAWSITMKAFIVQKFTQLFSADDAALLSGIVVGTTGTLSALLKAQMDASGTSYIVGMYGYKIAVLCGTMSALLKDHLPKKILLILLLFGIWFFIFASGGTVSAVRAGIMGSLVIVATALGRMTNIRNTLIFTVFIMVIFDPKILIDAAFQLSFLSFLGIYYLGQPIKNLFHWTDDGFLQWKEHAMLSLSTNIAILPVVIKTFGGFSLTSFISNILIMIPWAVIIFFGMAILIIGSIFPALTFFMMQIENILLAYEFFIIRVFAKYVVPLPNIFNSNLIIFFYYGLLGIFIYYYGEKV